MVFPSTDISINKRLLSTVQKDPHISFHYSYFSNDVTPQNPTPGSSKQHANANSVASMPPQEHSASIQPESNGPVLSTQSENDKPDPPSDSEESASSVQPENDKPAPHRQSENNEPAPLAPENITYTNSKGITLKIDDIIVLGVDTHQYWYGVIERFRTNEFGDTLASIAYLQEHKKHDGELIYSKRKGSKWVQEQSISSIISKLESLLVTPEIKEKLNKITEQEYEEFNDNDHFSGTISSNFDNE